MRFLDVLKRQWFLAILFLVFAVGFAVPGPGVALKQRAPYVVKVAVILALFLSSYGLSTKAIFRSLVRFGALGIVFLVSYVLTPLLAWAAGMLVWGPGSQMGTGLIVMAAMPCTLASAIIWTRLAGGNDALALAATATTNLLNFLVAPVILGFALGEAMQVPVLEVMQGLFFTLVLPITAGQVVRLFQPEFADRLKGPLSVVNRFLVLTMVWLSVCKAADSAAATEELTVVSLVVLAFVCLAVHAAALGAAWLAASPMQKRDRIAVAVAGSQKTLIVALYVIGDFFGGQGLFVVPAMFFHAVQLVFDSVLIEFWSRGKEDEG